MTYHTVLDDHLVNSRDHRDLFPFAVGTKPTRPATSVVHLKFFSLITTTQYSHFAYQLLKKHARNALLADW